MTAVTVRAALIAGTVSGGPSTVHALLTGGDVLGATKAAGKMLLPAEDRTPQLLLAGAVVHAGLSLFWSAALVAGLPRRSPVAAGAVAGLGIATLDLAVARRFFPAVADLPTAPQVADHVAFGVLVALARG